MESLKKMTKIVLQVPLYLLILIFTAYSAFDGYTTQGISTKFVCATAAFFMFLAIPILGLIALNIYTNHNPKEAFDKIGTGLQSDPNSTTFEKVVAYLDNSGLGVAFFLFAMYKLNSDTLSNLQTTAFVLLALIGAAVMGMSIKKIFSNLNTAK